MTEPPHAPSGGGSGPWGWPSKMVVAETTPMPRALGWLDHPRLADMRVVKLLLWPTSYFQGPNPKYIFFFALSGWTNHLHRLRKLLGHPQAK
jgi:hypothetical protein